MSIRAPYSDTSTRRHAPFAAWQRIHRENRQCIAFFTPRVCGALLAAYLVCSIAGTPARAGWPHRVPDFSEESTWTANHIFFAEVLFPRLFQVMQTFTPDELPFRVEHDSKWLEVARDFRGKERPLADSDELNVILWKGSYVFPTHRGNQPVPKTGDRLIVVIPKDRSRPNYGNYLLQPGVRPFEPDIADTLLAISKLRLPDAVDTDLVSAALQPEPLLAKYAMKRLLAAEVPLRDSHFQRELRAVRDAEDTGSDVALVASRLLSRLSGHEPLNRDEYEWLKTRVSQAKTLDMFCLRNLLRRIGEYSEQRTETIQLLTGLARDSAIPGDRRVACLDALTTPAIFGYEQPDRHSDSVVHAFVDLLGDENPYVRGRIAASLGKLGSYLSKSAPPSTEKRAYVDKITAVLHSAIERETHQGALLVMRGSVAFWKDEVRMRDEEDN